MSPHHLAIVISALCLFHPQRSIADESPAMTKPVEKKTKLVKKSLGSLRSLTVHGEVYLAGQPQQQDLALLKKEGIQTIITLRKKSEVSWDENAAATQAGLKFVALPFQKPDELTPEVFGKIRKILRDKKRGPTLLHCGSANRVGAVWYAHRLLDGKLSSAAALAEAKAVGLRSPALLERAQAYVKRVQSQPVSDEPVPNGSATR